MSAKNAFVPVKRVYSVNTYLRILLSHEGVSEVSEQTREWSKGVGEASRVKQGAVE